jgi:predicted aspartyl protease
MKLHDDMGAVRIKIRLTNLVDEDRWKAGEIPEDKVRRYEADALVDTGAVRSVLPVHVVETLGVRIRSQAMAEYAVGRKDTVGLTAGVLFNVMGREAVDDALVLGDEVLLGQTVLEKLDLFVDCNRQRLIPNPAHPDQPVNKVK